jgi:predicted DNA-binding helix-hairpin-helix protein
MKSTNISSKVEHMCYNTGMSDIEKLTLLTSQMHLEPAEDTGDIKLSPRGREAITVKAAQMPNGKRIRLLKTLLSSYCEQNCHYCPFRSERDIPRAAFTPDDFARLFDSLYKAGFVEGIFLSSSIFQGSITTQDKLLDTAWLLRHKYHFQGYLHLKIMPGVEQDQVAEAMLLANRLSINLEAPHPRGLSTLAPQKNFHQDLVQPLHWIADIRATQPAHKAWKGSWPSSTTQFVVGAANETDLEILRATNQLHQTTQIARVYYSSFNPIRGTPLENVPPSPPPREHRLYQAFYLIRDYGFKAEDLAYPDNGNLSLTIDPKAAWANQHLLQQPVEINHASRDTLLRVPGLGPTRVDRIITCRKQERLKSFSQLRKMNLVDQKSAPYLLINGKKPPQQAALL